MSADVKALVKCFLVIAAATAAVFFATDRRIRPQYVNNSLYGGAPLALAPLAQYTLLVNHGFVTGYSEQRMSPVWTAYRLSGSESASDKAQGTWCTDDRTKARVSGEEYRASGYSPCQMALSSLIGGCYGVVARQDTFLMSNVSPQLPSLRLGMWAKLEEAITAYARALGEIWVLVGPVFGDAPLSLQGPMDESASRAGRIQIPDAFYAILISEVGSGPRCLTFLIPQTASAPALLDQFITSVDVVEAMTGLDFLSRLDDSVENALEALPSAHLW